MNAIRFLTTVAKSVHHELFRNEDALKQVRCCPWTLEPWPAPDMDAF